MNKPLKKKYFFLSGMPRAGNTLLSSILNQNPNIGATANSLITDMLFETSQLKNKETFLSFPDHQSLDNVLDNIIPNYYKDWDCKYIVERSPVGTPKNLEILQKHLKQPIKIIALTRPILEVLSSFLKVSENWKVSDEKKCDLLMCEGGMIYNSLVSIENLSKTENKHMVHFVSYKDFVRNSKETIKDIYKFLEIPLFKHHFKDLEQFSANGISYIEGWLDGRKSKYENLHTIKTNDFSLTKHKPLPQIVIDKFKHLNSIGVNYGEKK